jgi:hypothetical protein
MTFGYDMATALRNMHLHGHSALSEGLVQVAVGVPAYLLTTLLALATVRAGAVLRRSRGGDAMS